MYTGNGSNVLSFSKGDKITVVDVSEDVWWKVEQDGVITERSLRVSKVIPSPSSSVYVWQTV